MLRKVHLSHGLGFSVVPSSKFGQCCMFGSVRIRVRVRLPPCSCSCSCSFSSAGLNEHEHVNEHGYEHGHRKRTRTRDATCSCSFVQWGGPMLYLALHKRNIAQDSIVHIHMSPARRSAWTRFLIVHTHSDLLQGGHATVIPYTAGI